ncbi:MAG: ABC transporter ATP-binding protein [Chloroflexota bacterium]
MTAYILETHELSKSFGAVTAVNKVNLQVPTGELFGFLGPNGAGKTTTIGMILGLIHPTNGRVTLFGKPVSPQKNTPLNEVGALIGAPALLPHLSGLKNLRLLAHLYNKVDEHQITTVLKKVGMLNAADRKVKTYSTGMTQRLGLAAALLHQPKLLILDEPTNGLDPAGMREIRDLLRQLAQEGMTIFLSSHLLHEIEQICDHIAVIKQGSIVAQGKVSDLLAQQTTFTKIRVTAIEQAKRLLTELGGRDAVTVDGDYLLVSGLTSETAVAHLVAHQIIPKEVSNHSSNLENIFLELTQEA